MSLLLTADWVLPVSSPPVRRGGVLVDDGRVTSVGPATELADLDPPAEHHDFPGCTITPGLVNAHTHLALTAMAGVLPPMPFDMWLARVPAIMRAWSPEDLAASAALGVSECLAAGVTTVGDIVYGPESLRAAEEAGLHGVFFWEALGIPADELPETLARVGFPDLPTTGGLRMPGLSPHAPYTSGPGLLRATHAHAARLGVPFALHVAESAAEEELMRSGTGPLADVARRLAPDFEPPGTGTVPYLASLGVLDDAIAIHLCHATDEDITVLSPTLRGAVVCPRSNAYLHNPTPPLSAMLDAGIATGVGTDSSASNADLDLMEDVRALRRIAPELAATTLLEIATLGGARALGLDACGRLEPGAAADVAVFAVTDPHDAEEALIAGGGSATLSAVMTSGSWRLGGDAEPGTAADATKRAEGARSRARAAVEGLEGGLQ